MNFDRVVEGTRFNDLATRFGFIVVYPKAEPGVYFNSGDRRLPAPGLDSSVDDVAFVGHLIERIGADYALDPSRLFATGQSNGASMAHRLGCELSDQIAAIGPVAGELMIECRPGQPVSVIEFHRLDDPIFPFMAASASLASGIPRNRART